MIKVGPICVDVYEASVWSTPTGGRQYGASADDYPCDDNGNNCTNIFASIFARSVQGVTPSRFITWFQAQQACASSGKRLLTNAEWQMAAAGTPDDTPCVVRGGARPGPTGLVGCESNWGVFDMVGGVWEWVADWVPLANNGGAHCLFDRMAGSDDFSCFFAGGTEDSVPGALIRGGNWQNGRDAGVFAIDGRKQPSYSADDIGFRCAR